MFNIMLIPFLIAMFLALNMGGSGTGPAFSVAYGSNIVRRAAIPGLFGIMVFLGALIGGKETSMTLGKGLLNPNLMSLTLVSIILLAVGISLLIANLFGIPQSTSQSTVLAVSAPAMYFSELNTHKLWFEIVPTWLVLPLMSFFLAFLIGKYIYKPIRRKGYTMSAQLNNSKILNALILSMSLYVAFSIGTNNVANAVGPITSMTVNEYGMNNNPESYRLIMLMSMLIIAPCFGIGSSIFGHRVVKKTGKEIVRFGKIEAVIIAFISASLLLLASVWKGIPSSLVQLNVAAILGIGVAKLGFTNIFRKTEVNQFFIMWIIAPAIAFSLCLLMVWIADICQLL
jgi:sulfate permease